MSKQQKHAQAWEWLEKAIKYEAEGKPKTIVTKSLERACALENEWYAMN